MIANPEQMLPARSVIRLLEEAPRRRDVSTFGLRMAERRELADLGMVSLLIAHQPTLGDALSVLGQYRNRINSTWCCGSRSSTEWRCCGRCLRSTRLFFRARPMIWPLPCSTGSAAACSVPAGSRSASASAMSLRPGVERAVYQRLFSCPVEFGSEFDGILIRSADLDRPNPRSEPALALHARKLVEAMVDPGERAWSTRSRKRSCC
jgi:hypothetical protein